MAIKRATLSNLTRFAADIESLYQKKADVVAYSLQKNETTETGFLATYQLTANGVATGAKINIPKDYLVKSGDVKVCAKADEPVAGYKKGDKYIDFVINVASGTADDQHMYIAVTDLVDVYTGSNAIDISDANVVSVKVDEANANGLKITENGLAMDVVSANGNGAMTSAMLATLNSALQPDDLPELPATTIGDAIGSGNVVTGLSIDPADNHRIIPTLGMTALTAADFEEYTDAEIDAIFGISATE